MCPLPDLKIFYSYVLQVILDPVEYDENIKTLLKDIRDVFDLGKAGPTSPILTRHRFLPTYCDTSATVVILSSRMESTCNSVCLRF